MKTKKVLRRLFGPLSNLVLEIELNDKDWVQSCHFLKEAVDSSYRIKSFDKSEFKFSIQNVSSLTPFQRKIYEILVKVPAGKTETYKSLAMKAKAGRAYRAVGSAMRTNPLVLYVPCHRVLKSDGGLGNYSGTGGVLTKEALLKIEKAL